MRTNKRIGIVLRAALLALSAVCGCGASETPPGMAPQPAPAFGRAPAGAWNYGWQGVRGRTYLLEWTTDMVEWRYLPLTEAGAGSKAFGGTSSTASMLLRLRCSDEIPDMAKEGPWHPPVLRITGPWQAAAFDTSTGQPVAGAALSCFRWPAGAPAPLTAPLMSSTTGVAGTFDFPPAALAPGERVEVRLTGCPNQRVWLPWLPGSETADTNIDPGGTGMAGAWLPPSPGEPGPSYDDPPAGEPGAGGGLCRLQDLMVVTQANNSVLSEVFPLGGNLLQWDWTSGNFTTSTLVDSLTANPHIGGVCTGWGFRETHLGELIDLSGSDFLAWIGAEFGDPALRRAVRKNHFVSGGHVTATAWIDIPNPVYQPEDFVFEDGAACWIDGEAMPYAEPECDHGGEYQRILVLGPVPAYVPKEVLGGAPFLFDDLQVVRLHAELPAGCPLGSAFYDPGPSNGRPVPAKIRWTATVTGNEAVHVKIESLGGPESAPGPVAELDAPNTSPMAALTFLNATPDTPLEGGFTVTLDAAAVIATEEHAPAPGQTEHTYTETVHPLGSFSVPFVLTAAGESSPASLAARQSAELRGAGMAPEGAAFNGGQRSRTLEPERRIGITGRPAPDSPTFVDALTGRFHHSETDFALSIPGSDLELAVTRSASESIWTAASGLRPHEDPVLPFGPAWDGNLTPVIVRSEPLDSAGEPVPMPVFGNGTGGGAEPAPAYSACRMLTVRDYQGRAFAFVETNGPEGVTEYLPDPTLIPDRAASGISLAASAGGGFVLRQPALGLTHTYEPAAATRTVPNNRHTPGIAVGNNAAGGNVSGFTSSHYHRLVSVTDRFGVTLAYSYGTSSANLIPETIQVNGRPDLRLRIRQDNGRVTAFWDPSGIRHSYAYEMQNLAPAGQTGQSPLPGPDEDPDPAIQTVLLSHSVGGLLRASYGYHHQMRADPRPANMRLGVAVATNGETYGISTNHIALNRIANAKGGGIDVVYQPSTVRQAWSTSARAYYHPVGDPLLVSSVKLPDDSETTFQILHTLKPGHPAMPAIPPPAGSSPGTPEIPGVAAAAPEYSIITKVTDSTGTHWTYTAGTPVEYHWSTLGMSCLPTAAALVFPSLERKCDDVADSAVTFAYDAAAGYGTTSVTDSAGRATTATYRQPYGHAESPYTRPFVAPGVRLHDFLNQPDTTTDTLDRTTGYAYTQAPGTPAHLLPETITDHRARVTSIVRHPGNARVESVQVRATAGGDLLSRTDFGYGAALPGLAVTSTRKAEGLGKQDDPAWVADLTTTTEPDANGFPFRTGHDADGNGSLGDPGDLATTTVHSPSGRVLSATAPGMGTRTVIHDGAGLPSATCAEDGAVTTVTRDAAGRPVLTRDALGHATGTSYDPLGRPLLAVRDMDGNLAWNPATGALTGVDPATDITASTLYLDADSETRHTSPSGHITVTRRDALGRIETIIAPGNDTPPGTVPTAATGRVTTFAYDPLRSPDAPVSITGPLGYATLFKYDPQARPTATLRQYQLDPPLYSGTFTGYDPATGLPATTTVSRTPLDENGDPAGTTAREDLVTRTFRDALDRPETVIAAEGTAAESVTHTRRTSTGIPWQTSLRVSPEIPATGTAPAVPARWAHTDIVCDSLGRVTDTYLPEVTDATTGQPVRPHAATVYHPLTGLPCETLDSRGQPTGYGHDSAGRVIWRQAPPVTDALSGMENQRPLVHFRYDPLGRLTRRVDPLGYAWSYRYDPAGRPTHTTGPVVSPERDDPARRQATWESQYDPAGNLLRSIDPEGRSTTFTHYPDGTLRTATTPVHLIGEDGSPVLTDIVHQYDRDAAGRLIRLTDGASQATAFTYDGLGRPLTATVDPDQPARARATATGYDALLVTSVTDPAAVRREFRYDSAFLPQALDIIDPATGQPGPDSLTYEHDPLGRVTAILPTAARLAQAPALGDPTVRFTYDDLGRTTSETSNSVTTAYGYDPDGRPVTLATPGRFQTTQYDPAGLPRRILDAAGGVPTVETLIGRDLAGRPVTEESGFLRHTRAFDPMGRLLADTLTRAGGSSPQQIQTVRCRYDLLSNLLRLDEIPGEPGLPPRTILNTYDERSQLLTETQYADPAADPILTTLHRYDAAENLTHTLATGPGGVLERVFTFGSPANGLNSNQLHTLTETRGAAPPETTTYGYDACGNRATRTRAGLTDTYSWDAQGRLIRQDLATAGAENGTWHYGYDPLARRISRAPGTPAVPQAAAARHFAFSGTSPVREWDGPDATVPATLRTGSGVGGGLLTRHPDGTATRPVHNHRGDITAILSANGALLWQGRYDAHGLPAAATGPRPGAYGPNGKWQEPGGLANDGFRHRDLATGTYLSPDPAGFIDGPNRYNHVRHNPWSRWDPNGLASYIIPLDTTDIGYVTPTTVDPASGGSLPPLPGGPGTVGIRYPDDTGPDGANPTLTGGLPFSITDIGLLQEIHDAMWAVLEAEIVHLREENERVMLTQGLKWTLSLNNTRAQIRFLADNRDVPEDIRAAARALVEEMNQPDERAGLPGFLARQNEKITDLIEGLAELPGTVVAGLINIAMATDVTTGAQLVYNGLGNGFGIREIPTTQRIISGALILVPMGMGRGSGAVDDIVGLGVRSGRGSPGLRVIGGHVDDIGERIAAMEMPIPGVCFVAGTPIETQSGGRNIETLEVGERVLTTDGDSSTEVDPATWRRITLRMPNPECQADRIDLELLRSEKWMAGSGCQPGARMWFELEEMGLRGWAEVLSVGECPPIRAGRGRVVLSTVTHHNTFVMELRLEGQAEPLRPTDRHRLFSITRNGWVPAATLQPGEELRTATGAARIASVRPWPGTHRVFNIEVETEHSYYAGHAKILSHNMNPCAEELFEIGEGVRRSKAAEMLNREKIPARIIREGQPDEFRDLPLGSLRSPKQEINAGTLTEAERMASVLEGTRKGTVPPIDVRPGTRGTPIKDVRIKYPGTR